MFIEYKIKFQKDGFTIEQSMETGSTAQAKPDAPVVQNTLGASVQDSGGVNAGTAESQGGGPFDRPKGGEPGAGGAPITLIGPFIFVCPCHKPAHDDSEASHGE